MNTAGETKAWQNQCKLWSNLVCRRRRRLLRCDFKHGLHFKLSRALKGIEIWKWHWAFKQTCSDWPSTWWISCLLRTSDSRCGAWLRNVGEGASEESASHPTPFWRLGGWVPQVPMIVAWALAMRFSFTLLFLERGVPQVFIWPTKMTNYHRQFCGILIDILIEIADVAWSSETFCSHGGPAR